MEMKQTVENEAEANDDWIIDFIGRSHYAEVMEKVVQRGWQKGRLKGWQEGRQEDKREIALNMLNMKYPLDEISRITKLNREEICQIAEDNNLTLS
ncbi:MAG: hypothetical protein K5787_02105 [Lentisphaeria bacterium]|nr:hypothetical protein [Lentisphaeria bacterium]